jgi:2-deoxy-D-gluconate 3-dehydrogenase
MVTGPGTGLGLAMTLALAEAGADVVGVYSRHVDDVMASVTGLGRRFAPIRLDLLTATPADLQGAVARAVGTMGRLDILLNNAGINRRGLAVEATPEDFEAVLQVNLRSAFYLSQAVAGHMREQRSGKIIHVASMTSFTGSYNVSAYSISKTAILGLTRSMANELASYNIQVNAIAPGFMVTPLTESLRSNPALADHVTQRLPIGRWGTPEDLQGAVVLLASPASDYMVGSVLVVDGGYLSR